MYKFTVAEPSDDSFMGEAIDNDIFRKRMFQKDFIDLLNLCYFLPAFPEIDFFKFITAQRRTVTQ